MVRIGNLGGWVLLVTTLVAPAWAGEPPAGLAKVHERVVHGASVNGDAEFLIYLDEQADLTATAGLPTKTARGREVFERLTEVATRTQAPLIAWLTERGLDHRPYWIANMIWARADLDSIATLAARADVRRIDANPKVRFAGPLDSSIDDGSAAPTVIEWGLSMIQADQVWALGYDGTGIVVAGQDTGYEWNHAALIAKYRGWDGVTTAHDYNWHDSIHSGGGSCGADSPEPCDDHSHGTHTMGTIVGDDGGANQIGVAPGARWMGCRNMNQGDGTPASYSECFEFFVAPTDVAGNNPDPSKAPHVINNSWSCPPSEGCDPDTLATVVDNTRAAGIVVVASAGNSGSGCGSIETPPAIYDASLTVGATDSSDTIAQFSSRGPVTIDGSDRPKPDLSAPGVSVRSSVPGGGYAFFSGTSMAGPHATGLVALVLDARPDLIGRVEEVESLMRLSAVPRTSSQECGGIPGSAIPNPVYGHGRIDAVATLVGDADGDGVDNLGDCSPVNAGVWQPPEPAGELMIEVNNLVTALTWSAPIGGTPGSVLYDVLRSGTATGFDAPQCLLEDGTATAWFEAEDPDTIFYYLVRATNECGGNPGVASDGSPRPGGPCPDKP